MLYFIFAMGFNDAWAVISAIIAYILVVAFSLSIHEFAHAFTAYKFGDLTPKAQGRLSLNPARHIDPLGALSFLLVGFGWAKPVQVNSLRFKNYKVGQSVVSLAGITVNLIIAFIFSGFYFFFGASLIASQNVFLNFLYYFLLFGYSINIALFFFNILPIYPLDGFNFVRTFLSYNNKFVQFMFKFGSLILFIIIITPLFDILFDLVVNKGIGRLLTMFWSLFV